MLGILINHVQSGLHLGEDFEDFYNDNLDLYMELRDKLGCPQVLMTFPGEEGLNYIAMVESLDDLIMALGSTIYTIIIEAVYLEGKELIIHDLKIRYKITLAKKYND